MSFTGAFVARVLRPLDEQIAAKVEICATGAPQDWASYREAVGAIRALRDARGLLVAELARLDPDAMVPRSP